MSLHHCKSIIASDGQLDCWGGDSATTRANYSASFVDTPLLGEAHGQAIRKMLSVRGLDFALPEDCVKAVMRIATDTSINGNRFLSTALVYS
jgi:hypothetical protein